MYNRREFIRTFSGTAACLTLGGIPLSAYAKKEIVQLTIIHTNDVHSHIDPFADNDINYPALGGVKRRSAVINNIRMQQNNVLLLDAGDIFQGTPYFNMYGGELEFKLMSRMGYDAATIGNHDFDNGVDGLVKQLPHADFPFIMSNYDFTDTSMNEKTIPWKIFNKEGIKIGVFALGIELEGLVLKKLYGNTKYLDPLQKTNEITSLLKNEMKCDLIICLSHLGYKYNSNKICDHLLAQNTENIDLIIGGHTHTFLDTPVEYKNKQGKKVLVAQVGWAGIKLGRINYFFKKEKMQYAVNANSIKISEKTIAN